MACVLWALRINMWAVVPVIILLGTVLFIVRLVRERRMRGGNLLGVVTVLVLVAAIPIFGPRPVYYMTRPNGAPRVGIKT